MLLIVDMAGAVSDHRAAYGGHGPAPDCRAERRARTSTDHLGLRGTSGKSYQ